MSTFVLKNVQWRTVDRSKLINASPADARTPVAVKAFDATCGKCGHAWHAVDGRDFREGQYAGAFRLTCPNRECGAHDVIPYPQPPA